METVIKKSSTRLNNVTLLVGFALVMNQMDCVDRAVISPNEEGEMQIERES